MESEVMTEEIVALGMARYSAKGIVRAIKRRHRGTELTPSQVYGVLRYHGVKLWDLRHAKTPQSLSDAVKIISPPRARRRAG